MDKKIAIQAALMRQLFTASKIAQFASIILAALLVYIQRDVIDSEVVLVWGFMVVLVALLLTALAITYLRSDISDNSAIHSRLIRFRLGIFVSGMAWGSASILLFPANNPQHQIFLVFILAGLTAGALVSYSADLISAIIFNVSVIIPLIIRLFIAEDGVSVAMSMALMLYLGFMIMSVREINRNVSENITLHLEAAVRENMARISEQRYRLLLNHSPAGIIHYDNSLIITYWNDRFADMLPSSAERLNGLDINTLKDQSVLPAMRKALEGGFGHYEGCYSATFSDSHRWVAVTCAPSLDGERKIVGGVAIIQDITERKRTEKALQESHQQMDSLLNSMAEGAYGVDTNGNCTFVNRSFLKILGYDHPEEVIGKHIHELIHHSHPDGSPYPSSECKMNGAYRHNHEIHVTDEVFWKKDGTAIPIEYWSKPLPVDNVLQGAIATFIDITDRKLAEEQIRHLAFYDSLTKVANRCLLNDRLDQTIVASKRTSRYGALMFLDLDNLKLLNDTHGHEVGDELLIEAARRIGSCIRETDTVARFGGDEFVVLLGELNEDQSDSTVQASNVAEKIRTLMSEPHQLLVKQDGNEEITVEHHCTASIGVAVFNHQASREDILKWADMAMYEAKKAGRNCVVFNKQCSSKTGMDQKRLG